MTTYLSNARHLAAPAQRSFQNQFVWLIQPRYLRTLMEVLRRVHAATLRWDSIERVADRLLRDGHLSARQVRALGK